MDVGAPSVLGEGARLAAAFARATRERGDTRVRRISVDGLRRAGSVRRGARRPPPTAGAPSGPGRGADGGERVDLGVAAAELVGTA